AGAQRPREGVETEKEHIDLKVAGQDGSVVQFRIKRHTPLRKLMKAYCCRQVGEEQDSVVWFGGRREFKAHLVSLPATGRSTFH
uniref:Rad60/SUMO-like domain-containing protein n=1 Tax=Zosterops lateralis melanops TaxID=1220523 RepID=A0A8D2QPA7_ZOSLA